MLRESIRRMLPWIADGVWFVLSLRERALDVDAVAVYMDMGRTLERAGLFERSWSGANWRADA